MRVRIQFDIRGRENAKSVIQELCEFTGYRKKSRMLWHVLQNFKRIKLENEDLHNKLQLAKLRCEVAENIALKKGDS